jgi:Na+/proline symporter
MWHSLQAVVVQPLACATGTKILWNNVRTLDWIVFFGWLTFLVSYGLYRGRGSSNVAQYLLAGKTMPWYAMGLSIMATQASAITFVSTTGQGYVDGMRFVQFYFGLPVAMVILSATAVPIFHRARVFTAYEYLEQRFDAKTRALVGVIFLIERGLASGIALYAPAVVLSVVVGWPDRLTTIIMGVLVVLYTASGGIKAVTWADVQQMMMILAALLLSLGIAISLLPGDISFLNAVRLAGAAGRLNAVDLHFDWNNRYNVWSGLIGGTFLSLAYFGTDQSQVQRYLTGRSIAQSRLSLLFNAMAKIPMQAFILFIGTMVFAVHLFVPPPAIFQPVEAKHAAQSPAWPAQEARYQQAFAQRRDASYAFVKSQPDTRPARLEEFRAAQTRFDAVRKEGLDLAAHLEGAKELNDTNYIFLSFVKTHMPLGVVGLLIAVIFTASMSSTAGEINSLAAVTVIDIYRRFFKRDATDRHYLWASRLCSVFWGAYAVTFAATGSRGFGALIERVNIVGSLFYGGMLGAFVLAFGFRRVGGTAAFCGIIAGELTIFYAAAFTKTSFLWYNPIGCVVVVAVGLVLARFFPAATPVGPERSALT